MRFLLPDCLRGHLCLPVVVVPSPSSTRQHPWFRTHLPPYLRLSPAEHDAQREMALDVDALALIASVGYPDIDSSDAALRVMHSEDHPLSREITVVYELAVDETRRQKRARGAGCATGSLFVWCPRVRLQCLCCCHWRAVSVC